MEVRLLGPVDLHAAGRRWEIRPPQRLLVLAALAVDAGRVVPVDTMLHRVWERPPEQARRTLHTHISRLRAVLRDTGQDGARVLHRAGGYVLQLDAGSVDLHRFRALAARARATVADEEAAELFAEAARLWRGDALTGVQGRWPESVRASWERERVAAEVDRADVLLRLGRHAEILDDLAAIATAYPRDERVAAQYMLALYRCGRQADALAHYERVRKHLDHRVGVLSVPLRELRQRILGGDPDLMRAPAAPRAPAAAAGPAPLRARRTLPADTVGFVGRDEELRHLFDSVDAAVDATAHAPAIIAVDGMAGIGKTAFVVHAAHRLAGRFPDGQRFVDLRAHAAGATPLDASEALEILLQADGVAARQIPTGVEARAGLWRERMADRRFLLVVDDAADAAHVCPLLPASPGCLVLITSRRKLSTLPGAIPLPLRTLTPEESVSLFAHRAGARAHDAQATVEKIARLCGHLPLAVTLTAARLHTHPAWSVGDLAAELAQARDRLSGLASGDLAVAAAFDLSCRDLPAGRQRLFRRLALHPGPDLDVHAAAALDGTTPADARRGVEELLEHNLLTEPYRGRFRFHDLIAAHARARLDADPEAERAAAWDRLLTYYLGAATAAARHHAGFAPVTGGTGAGELPPVADGQRAADWFDTELSALTAVVTAAAARRHRAALGIPAALHEHLRQRGPFDLAIRLHDTALSVARETGDRRAEARTLVNLSHIRMMSADFEAAAGAAEHALELFRSNGDPTGQADALDALARVRHVSGDYPSASRAAELAHALHQQLGNRRGEALALELLARVQAGHGDYPTALASAGRAHALFGELDEPHGLANTLLVLALLRYVTGDCPAAAPAAEQARVLYERCGDQVGQATAMDIQARVRVAAGDWHAAAITAERSSVLHERLGDRVGHANALETLARAHHAIGEHTRAATTAGRALALYRRMNAPHGQANAVQIIGIVHHATGDRPAALAALDQALALFREVSDPDGEAETLNHLGQTLLDADAEAATERFGEALAIARRIGTPAHEGRALEGIGHCLPGDEGVRHLSEALAVYRRIGSPCTGRVEAALKARSR
jgi:DNA-binding SARP family transcriptional activator